jgi:hypothetical protein
MSLKCCEVLNIRSLCYFICFNLSIFLATFLLSTHRFYSINDVSKAITIYNLAESSGESRCKEVNSTEFICLPSVLFIGASKCGTTTLTDQLASHSKVHFVGRRITPTDHHREVHRFDRNSYEYAIKSIEYLDELASSPRVSNINDPIIHYTPHYFFSPSVPFEVKSFYKHSSRLKFILMLRDPVDRALSSYWFKNSHLFHESDLGELEDFWNHSVAEILERHTLEECMCAELAKVVSPSVHVTEVIEPLFSGLAFQSNMKNNFFSKTYGINLPNKCYFSRILEILHRITSMYYSSDDFNHPHYSGGKKVEFLRAKYFTSLEKCYSDKFRGGISGHSLIEKGIYADQLVRWLVNFPSKSQFYLINYKTWVNSQDLEYKKLLLFLGLNITSLDSDEDKTLGNNMVNNSLVASYENDICLRSEMTGPHYSNRHDNSNSVEIKSRALRSVNKLVSRDQNLRGIRRPSLYLLNRRMSESNSSFDPQSNSNQIRCDLLTEADSITRNETSFKRGRLIKPNSRTKSLVAEQRDELVKFFIPYNMILEIMTTGMKI